jgi:hypothetical protein
VVDDFIDRIMSDPRLNANPRVDEAHHRVSPAGFQYHVTEMACWAARTGLQSLRSPASRPLTQAFRSYVEQRNNENPEDGGSDHAAEHRRAHRLARDGPGPPRNNQGQ